MRHEGVIFSEFWIEVVYCGGEAVREAMEEMFEVGPISGIPDGGAQFVSEAANRVFHGFRAVFRQVGGQHEAWLRRAEGRIRQ